MQSYIIRFNNTFNNNAKKTCEYINQLEKIDHFDFRSGLKNIIPYLSSKLNISEKEFYNCYLKVKDSFAKLTDDVILVKKVMEYIQSY